VATDERSAALRAFRRRAMAGLYPISAVLVAAAIFFNARGDTIGIVCVVALVLLAAGWNVYYFLVWRPGFERRFPKGR
jgi:hypothetical protein